MVIGGGQHEWRVAVKVLVVWVGTVREQRHQTVVVAVTGGPQQSFVHVVRGELVKFARQHALQRRQVALRRYRHQRAVYVHKVLLYLVTKTISLIVLVSFLINHYGRPAQQMWTLYFCPAVCSIFFFVFPRLISAVTDWMCTVLPHGLALVRI